MGLMQASKILYVHVELTLSTLHAAFLRDIIDAVEAIAGNLPWAMRALCHILCTPAVREDSGPQDLCPHAFANPWP